MIYLESFKFPSFEQEDKVLIDYYHYDPASLEESYFHKDVSGNYPFGVLSDHCLESLDFAPITILYGGNGSGKSPLRFSAG